MPQSGMRQKAERIHPIRRQSPLSTTERDEPSASITRHSQDMVARGIAALALVAVLSLLLVVIRQQPTAQPTATPYQLLDIHRLGGGLTLLMIEEYHRHAWDRRHFTLDTSVTINELQAIADNLQIRVRIRDIVENRRIRAFVATGGAMPQGLAEEIAQQYGPKAHDLFEIGCSLNWLALQGVVVPQYTSSMRDQLQESYLAAFPKVTKRVNMLLERNGFGVRLQEAWPGDPNEVMEACLSLTASIESTIASDPGW